MLSNGEVTKALKVTADKFSAQARAKLEAAGGTVTQLMPTFEEAKAAKHAAHVACKHKKAALAAQAALKASAEK